MRAVVSRVTEAAVLVDDHVVGELTPGVRPRRMTSAYDPGDDAVKLRSL